MFRPTQQQQQQQLPQQQQQSEPVIRNNQLAKIKKLKRKKLLRSPRKIKNFEEQEVSFDPFLFFRVCSTQSKKKKVGQSRKSEHKAGCTEGAWMTLQVCQKILASQAVMGLMISHLQIFRARSIISAFVIPMLILLFRECPTLFL